MAVTAYKTPGTCANVDRDAAAEWADVDNAKTSNDNYASVSVLKTEYTDWLRVTNLGFTTTDIPSGSTIDGFDVKVERKAFFADNICDSALYLRKTAGQQGSNKASAVKWGTSDAEITYSWTSGQFGVLSESDVRDSGFGIDLSALNDDDDTTIAYVDCISIRVYYTSAAPIEIELKSSTNTRAALALLIEVALSLRSSTDTRASLKISVTAATELELRSSTDTRAIVSLDTGIEISLRSSTDIRADLIIAVAPELACRSSTDTRASIDLETVVSLILRAISDTRAGLTAQTIIGLSCSSLSDTRAALALTTIIILGLRSSTVTRTALELTIAVPIELALRTVTATRAAIELNTLVLLAMASLTGTRAALALTLGIVGITYYMLDMSLPSRELVAAIPDRTLEMKVNQNG